MRYQSSTFILAGLLALLTVSACGRSDETIASEKAAAFADTTDNNVLTSSKFGISIRRPEGWNSLDYEQLNNLVEAGTKVATSGKDDLNAIVEATKKNNYNIFAVMKYEAGSPVEENPNVFGLAERISHAPGIKRGRDYFFHSKKLMKQANPNFIFTEGYKTRVIDGVEFDQMDLTIELAGSSSAQSYYAARHNDFMILIVQSYISDEGRIATDAVIETITLDW